MEAYMLVIQKYAHQGHRKAAGINTITYHLMTDMSDDSVNLGFQEHTSNRFRIPHSISKKSIES
jgi:hypothetical protein